MNTKIDGKMPVVIPGLNGRRKKSENFPQYPSSVSIRLYSAIRLGAESKQPTQNENKTTLKAPVQLESLLQGLRYFQATSRLPKSFALTRLFTSEWTRSLTKTYGKKMLIKQSGKNYSAQEIGKENEADERSGGQSKEITIKRRNLETNIKGGREYELVGEYQRRRKITQRRLFIFISVTRCVPTLSPFALGAIPSCSCCMLITRPTRRLFFFSFKNI